MMDPSALFILFCACMEMPDTNARLKVFRIRAFLCVSFQ